MGIVALLYLLAIAVFALVVTLYAGPGILMDAIVWRFLVPRGRASLAATLTRVRTVMWSRNPEGGARIAYACALLHRRPSEEEREWMSRGPAPATGGLEDVLLAIVIAVLQGEPLRARQLREAIDPSQRASDGALYLADLSTAMCVANPGLCRTLRPIRRRLFPPNDSR